MAALVVSCPYCNTTVTLVGPANAGQRIQCPRCEESFPYRGDRSEDSSLVPGVGATLLANGQPELATIRGPARPRWKNRSVGLTVLGIMGLMAAAGFTLAWFTKDFRRENDKPKESGNVTNPQIVALAPSRWPALGYMPADVNVLVGLRVAELLGDTDTRNLLVQLGNRLPRLQIAQLEGMLGIPVEDLDHLVVGLKPDEKTFLGAILAVRTRQPYDGNRVRSALKASPPLTKGDRTLYRFGLNNTSFEAVLWCHDERTLVFGLTIRDVDGLSLKPIPGLERFPPSVQRLLGESMTAGTPVWVVGSSGDWEKILSLLPTVRGLSDQDRKILGQVRTFGVWLQLNQEVTAQLAADCADATAASALDRYLARIGLAADRLAQLFGQNPELAALGQALSSSLTREQKDSWLFLKMKASVGLLRQALSSNH